MLSQLCAQPNCNNLIPARIGPGYCPRHAAPPAVPPPVPGAVADEAATAFVAVYDRNVVRLMDTLADRFAEQGDDMFSGGTVAAILRDCVEDLR